MSRMGGACRVRRLINRQLYVGIIDMPLACAIAPWVAAQVAGLGCYAPPHHVEHGLPGPRIRHEIEPRQAGSTVLASQLICMHAGEGARGIHSRRYATSGLLTTPKRTILKELTIIVNGGARAWDFCWQFPASSMVHDLRGGCNRR